VDDPRDLTGALDGIRTVFIAIGSAGTGGVLRRIAISAAAWISSIGQVTRLSVLNTSADSLGINQRAHYSIDQFAASAAVPYSTIRPAIFSASLLAAAPEVPAWRTWTCPCMPLRMVINLGPTTWWFRPISPIVHCPRNRSWPDLEQAIFPVLARSLQARHDDFHR